ncbi:MAG TPA: four helix bundle protein [Gemmatimonadales bacterium]|nr:four helix bundle protein [Gemmatimonadales bacterium]
MEVVEDAFRWFRARPNGTTLDEQQVSLGSVAPPYQQLHAWRESHELALNVFHVTKTFPRDERYGLTSQLRRAAFSAAVNIVEGSSRKSRKDFRRFLDISLASLTEVGYALLFAKEAGFLDEASWKDLSDRQNRARFLTWRLYRALAGEQPRQPPPTFTDLDNSLSLPA